MTASFLEIVETAEGDFVLQRADEQSEPLVRIHISAETKHYLADNALEVAKVMMQAGIQAAAALAERDDNEAELELNQDSSLRVLH